MKHKLDESVITTLLEKVFTPARIRKMMEAMGKANKAYLLAQTSNLKPLQEELNSLKVSTDRLYEAVEKGILPINNTLHERAQKLEDRRNEVLLEIANVKQEKQMPADILKPKNIAAFTKAIRARLLDKNSRFAKEYLKLLITEIMDFPEYRRHSLVSVL